MTVSASLGARERLIPRRLQCLRVSDGEGEDLKRCVEVEGKKLVKKEHRNILNPYVIQNEDEDIACVRVKPCLKYGTGAYEVGWMCTMHICRARGGSPIREVTLTKNTWMNLKGLMI